MFDQFQSQEQKEKEFERKLKQLEIEEDSLSQETVKLFESLGITPKQIEQLFHQSDFLSKEEIVELESMRRQLEEKLKQQVENLHDPKKTEEEYKKRRLPPNALFCR